MKKEKVYGNLYHARDPFLEGQPWFTGIHTKPGTTGWKWFEGHNIRLKLQDSSNKLKTSKPITQIITMRMDLGSMFNTNISRLCLLKSWSRSSTSYKNLLATPFLPLLAPSTTISVGVNVGGVSNLEGSS